jgi:hypothetical protein
MLRDRAAPVKSRASGMERTPGHRTEVTMEERIVVADPVADPQGYQRELLALLGGQDPIGVMRKLDIAILQQRAHDQR